MKSTVAQMQPHLGTETRKRKREADKGTNLATATPPVLAAEICFENAAFSSTPKKLVAAKRRHPRPLKENTNLNPFFITAGLETKSIVEAVTSVATVVSVSDQDQSVLPANPYEVLRKPPKKKKRETEREEACFENPALNLELPEKLFNPYEVVRTPQAVPQQQCFVNAALNLRGYDAPASRNPYEIQRVTTEPVAMLTPVGVENCALEQAAAGSVEPTKLRIGLPFTPTLGCRIDFRNISMSQLTPSKLLAEKLIFSPVPKRSLDSIGEQSSALDIGRELDRYQLELENSINEAKMRRNVSETGQMPEVVIQTIAAEPKITFTQRLDEIAEAEEEEAEEYTEAPQLQTANVLTVEERQEVAEIQGTIHFDLPFELETTQHDAAYASESDDAEDFDFKAPARFVRAYRRDDCTQQHMAAVSKESMNSNESHKSNVSAESADAEHKKSTNVKNLIRKSIRKLMHPLHHNTHSNDVDQHPLEQQKHTSTTGHIISSIRHSLRRKPKKQPPTDEEIAQPAEISIIDTSERTIKLKANAPHAEVACHQPLSGNKKDTLRSSLRQTTRGMRQQLMKSVFHKKQEQYAFCK